ncbi:MAG: VCBS repeat-containing protein, partial [Acidobacteriota bacterium]
ISMVTACGCRPDSGPPPTEIPSRMVSVEQATEDFANAILDLGIALGKGNLGALTRSIVDPIEAKTVTPHSVETPREVQLIRGRTWALAERVQSMTSMAFVHEVQEWLKHFSEIEDVRFKVKKSTVLDQGRSIEAKLALAFVGRNHEGRREWARGRAQVHAVRHDDGWRLDRFEMTEMHSLEAEVDVFSEVAQPADLVRKDPTFLERTGPAFAAYGAATSDLDGDGLLDLVTTAETGINLYLNRGDGSFHEASDETLVASVPGDLVAPLLLDIDNDGDTDLFLSAIGTQKLLENRLIPDGTLEFWDVSLESGVARPALGFSAVAGDVNRDGFPDIYVASYNRYGEILPDRWDGATNGTPNLLFLNQGDGSFEEVGAAWGVADDRWGYASGFADIDSDGDLDLYTTNDFGGGNALYINQGDHFRDEARERGVYDGAYGMGVSFADFDRDGDLDLHVTRMSSTAGRRILSRLGGGELPSKERLESMAVGNALYRNDGTGHFSDVSTEAGPFGAGWAWGGGFVEIDNDGWPDVYTPNGFISGSKLHDT